MFEKISKIIGFTQTEIKVTVFIISAFILGFAYKHFYLDKQNISGRIQSDLSILQQENVDISKLNGDLIDEESLKSNDKTFDYKQEVLDFNNRNLNNLQRKVIPAENSINLNSADINDLMNLPGIGEKTAKNILDYRNSIKKFTNVKQLLDVKGIGNAKFEKIKKYIFID